MDFLVTFHDPKENLRSIRSDTAGQVVSGCDVAAWPSMSKWCGQGLDSLDLDDGKKMRFGTTYDDFAVQKTIGFSENFPLSQSSDQLWSTPKCEPYSIYLNFVSFSYDKPW